MTALVLLMLAGPALADAIPIQDPTPDPRPAPAAEGEDEPPITEESTGLPGTGCANAAAVAGTAGLFALAVSGRRRELQPT